ncbi:hypothetical protein OAL19_01430 [bacterium]|nr:hypothetical protein [Mariniblastus sp.]MDC0311525.1 hypothetical protein [bacterium]
MEWNTYNFSKQIPSRIMQILKSYFRITSMCLAISAALLAGGFSAHAQTEEVMAQENEEVQKFFEQAHDALDDALNLFDDAETRPEEGDLRFYDFLSRTKESQTRKVESYLDVAGEALGISSISNRRQLILDLRESISENQRNISTFKRKRISAPATTFNPLGVTKSGYDKKIELAKDAIVQAENSIEVEKETFVKDLNRIGMDLDSESIDNLLESITGDEFVRVSIIFNNAKTFAGELERLTNETGEDLEAAKKYYGVYLMLLKTVSRLQEQFVESVDNEYYPKLDEFAAKARKNIKEAKRAIAVGGDETVLRNNIASNQLTYDAAMFYKEGLAHQKHQMMMANLECKKNILTAANTYKTVALSKDVAALMAVSRRAFDAISGLSVPDLRPFENERMKDAFSQLTRELRK